MKYLVTGAAGFIGSAVVERLCAAGHDVVGIDNINDYYEITLKQARLSRIEHASFTFIKIDIADRQGMADLFTTHKFDKVVHLAAQAGVRYSIENPMAYADSNLIGHLTILEGCRHNDVKHLIYASSSSVYGLNNKVPFATSDTVDHPVSLYAATKKSNELMAHSYSHLYNIPTTGLRFFTVYGSWGRPDMAPHIFTKKILNGDTIDINNNGDMWRDFTHVNDIVEGLIRVLDKPALPNVNWKSDYPDSATSKAPWRIYNIGNNTPVELLDYIKAIEEALGIEAEKELLPLQLGDVPDTFADVDDLVKEFNYKPSMPVKKGIVNFVEWFKAYYNC